MKYWLVVAPDEMNPGIISADIAEVDRSGCLVFSDRSEHGFNIVAGSAFGSWSQVRRVSEEEALEFRARAEKELLRVIGKSK